MILRTRLRHSIFTIVSFGSLVAMSVPVFAATVQIGGIVRDFNGLKGELISATAPGFSGTVDLISPTQRANRAMAITQFCVVSFDSDTAALRIGTPELVTDPISDGCVEFRPAFRASGGQMITCVVTGGTNVEGCSVTGILID